MTLPPLPLLLLLPLLLGRTPPRTCTRMHSHSCTRTRKPRRSSSHKRARLYFGSFAAAPRPATSGLARRVSQRLGSVALAGLRRRWTPPNLTHC
jgi:hypothetical protein